MKTSSKTSSASSAKKTTSASELETLKQQKVILEKSLEEMAQLQEESRAVQEKANYLQEAVDTGFAAIEFLPDGTILTANANFCQTMEYASEEIVGQHHRMFCDSDYADSAEYKNFWAELAQGSVNAGEFERVTKNGHRVWLNASYTPVKDAEGKVVKVIKMATDVTEMIAARLQGENIQAAVDTGWARIEFEPNGTIVTANNNFLSVLGYSEEKEVVGEHHQIFCEEGYAQSSAYKEFWNNLAAGQIQAGEFQRKTRTGGDVWINASYTPVKNAEGKVVRVIKIATDVSAIKFPVLQVRDIISSMAQGDLTRKFEATGEGYVQEMGDALNVAIENLGALLGSIGKSASLVANSASSVLEKSEGAKHNTTEVASAIAQMSKGAQDQALKTDESSKLVEQVKASSSGMETKADSIYRTAEKGQQSCENGIKIIKNLIENMSGINDSATTTSESITVLTQRAEEIGRTLNVITDIASQTNLLALNAAIEAARAGDAGRGFAVVAEEIRKLAEDSRRSAVDIEKIIGDVQKDTQSASKAIETMSVSVKDGSEATQEASTIFEEIAQASSETLSFSKDIQEATSAQKSSIDTVAKNIEQIVVVAEETAAGSEEVASSSQQLNGSMQDITEASNTLTDIAEELQKGIRQFKLRDTAQ